MVARDEGAAWDEHGWLMMIVFDVTIVGVCTGSGKVPNIQQAREIVATGGGCGLAIARMDPVVAVVMLERGRPRPR